MRFYALTSLVAACLFSGSAFAQSPVSARLNPTADFAFINGKIYTMDPENPTAEAITIEGDMITYVGTASGLPSKIGLGTEVIDLEGKMVLPGFVDGHTHALVGGIINTGVDLQTDDLDVLFERIRKYVAENRGHEVIRGYGVRFNPWTDGWPTAAMLDEIEAERPIFLFAIDGHKAWVNSRALEIAGIDKDTPDTVPGYSYFERDAEGNPTGWIVESAAFMQVLSALLDLDKNAISAGAAAWAQRFSAAGITAVHDYGFTGIGDETGFEIMQGLESSGDLSYRLQGIFYWNDPSIDPVSKILDLRSKYDSDLVSAGAIKINLDGGDDSWNALFTEPYSDRPEIKVSPIIPYDILNDVVQRADAAGVNVVCHCFGDLAVRKFLDSIELAIKANPDRDRRNVASHALLVHPNDIPRFAKLGVTYDTTGSWMTFDPLLQTVSTERLGAERVKAMFPVNRIAKAGGNFSFGSDWPVSGYVSEYRPLAAIERGVTRQMKGREDVAPLGGEEAKIPLQLALEAHTINAAYGMNMSDEIGSLEVGKKADLVVLGKDLYEIEPSEISEVEVLYTVMGGSLTHDHTKEAAE